jgi:hypothetical protein
MLSFLSGAIQVLASFSMWNSYPDHSFTSGAAKPGFYPPQLITQLMLPEWADKEMLKQYSDIALMLRHNEKPLYDVRGLHTAMVDAIRKNSI